MAFKKFQRAERVREVDRESTSRIRGVVKAAGKQSAADLNESERKQLRERLDN